MGDNVQRALEGMIPELEDLQDRGIVSAEEVRVVVKRRRDFEYLLQRRVPSKADYLAYIEYEQQFEKLRVQRKRRRGLTKPGIGDYSGKRRIQSIFERAVRRFKGDLELWHQAIDYSLEVKSDRVASQRLSEAVRLHPRHVEFWVKSGMFHFERCNDMSNARVLMQSGLRVNKGSAHLWAEYLRLEALYIYQIRQRRVVLGIEDQNNDEKSTNNDKEEVNLELLFKGDLLRIVYRNAMQAMRDSLLVRKQMCLVMEDFFGTLIGPVVKEIADLIWSDATTGDFVSSSIQEHCWEELACFTFRHQPDVAKATKAALEVFRTALGKLKTPLMQECYVKFLIDRRAAESQGESTGKRRSSRSRKPDSVIQSAIRELVNDLSNPSVETVEMIARSFINEGEILEKCAALAPGSLKICEYRMNNLATTAMKKKKKKNTEGDDGPPQYRVVFRDTLGVSLQECTSLNDYVEKRKELEHLYLHYLNMCIADEGLGSSQVINEFFKAAKWFHVNHAKFENTETADSIASIFEGLLNWVALADGSGLLSKICKRIECSGIPAVLPPRLFQHIIKLLVDKKVDVECIREKYTQATFSHPTNLQLWVDFINFERALGDLTHEQAALTRAMQSVEDEAKLLERLRYDK